MRNALAAALPLVFALCPVAVSTLPLASWARQDTRSASTTVAETTWVGHRSGQAGNYWEVGVGPRRAGVSPDGIWTFDAPVHGDSLQGWWPVPFPSFGDCPTSDRERAWCAADQGNAVNGVLAAAPEHRRSTGVVGVWHVDRGRDEGSGVTWAPLAGSGSAWCGLRRHGDLSEMDPITGNPFNQAIAERTTFGVTAPGGVSARAFPGYGDQWDQMLYRDIVLNDGDSLTVSFRYLTRMSTACATDPARRAGWFDKDPFELADGDFISSTEAGASAPRDSFMVYVGAPTDEAACRYTGGWTAAIYDPLRRWFSEVLQVNETGVPYLELLSRAGDAPQDTLAGDTTFAVTLPNLVVQPILDAQAGAGGIVRLVFRVKTNNDVSDQSGGTAYSSFSRGAAAVDEVTVNSTVIGAFDSPLEIDNRASVPATSAWKSTGKPPEAYWHVDPMDGIGWLTWAMATTANCGAPCDMAGGVLATGVHWLGDTDEVLGYGLAPFGQGAVSPSVCLVASGAAANDWGLTAADVAGADEIGVAFDVQTGAEVQGPYEQDDLWFVGAQCYPVTQPDGTPVWSEVRFGAPQHDPLGHCVGRFEPLLSTGAIVTSNASGVPDSIRIAIARTQRHACPLGYWDRNYKTSTFDNVSLGFVHAARPVAGSLAVGIGQWINDTFPFNDDDALPGTAAFDTCAALLKTGINIAPPTGDVLRFDVPADTTVIAASGDGMRVDLVFRILPGPGNHVVVGDRASALRRVPTSAPAATAGDGSFWGAYLADAGTLGTPGGHPGGTWSADVWNSARCDTAERNLFPVLGGNAPGPTAGYWATMYHEDDPKFGTLGILKNRCFLVDPGGPADHTNTTCGEGVYPPAWVTSDPTRSGYPGTPQTREFTKILPDGLLTPGSHVQYFVRKSALASPTASLMVPDTGYICPQPGEGPDYDGHRWQRFMVLPDRWKDVAFGGWGPACMLYVDGADRRGEERVFTGLVDSSCSFWGPRSANAPAGWSTRHTRLDYWGMQVGADPAIAVWKHESSGSPFFDTYAIKGAESSPAGSLGSRLANTANMGLLDGKQSKQGPTPMMLRTYYDAIYYLSGDLPDSVLGPLANRSQDDARLLADFLMYGANHSSPRGLFAMGSGFVASLLLSYDPALQNLLGAYLRDDDYALMAGSWFSRCRVDLLFTSVLTSYPFPCNVWAAPRLSSDDVFDVDPGLPGAAVATYYENLGSNGPFIASVFVPSSTSHPCVTLTSGWTFADMSGPAGTYSAGRLAYLDEVAVNVFGSLCPTNAYPPWGCAYLDVPAGPATEAVDFLRLRNNPLVSGTAGIEFGLARADRAVVRIYDVAGRCVRTLADGEFAAGAHMLGWDGTDVQGRHVGHGVYFAALRCARHGFHAERKLTILY
jgi:hypothetical protein